jgi:hypothetical protein
MRDRDRAEEERERDLCDEFRNPESRHDAVTNSAGHLQSVAVDHNGDPSNGNKKGETMESQWTKVKEEKEKRPSPERINSGGVSVVDRRVKDNMTHVSHTTLVIEWIRKEGCAGQSGEHAGYREKGNVSEGQEREGEGTDVGSGLY